MKPTHTLAASIALLTAAVAPVHAADEWNPLLVKDDHLEWNEQFPTFTLDSFAPTPELPFNLGMRERPWQTVYAEGYWSNGQRGMDGNVKISAGCALVVRGGLIIGTTGLQCPR